MGRSLVGSLLVCVALACSGGTTPPGTTGEQSSTPDGSSSSTLDPGQPDAPAGCTPSCAGRQCGDDGCGGTCGRCSTGATCTAQGTCQTALPPAPPSLNCQAGQRCTYPDRIAYAYVCTESGACTRVGTLAVYASFEACQTWGCMGGNSRCGDQFGFTDPDRLACEACKASCHEDGPVEVCQTEVEGGCSVSDQQWGPYLAQCTCQ